MGKRSALDKASSLVHMSETAPESPTSSTKSSLLGAQPPFLFSSVPGSSVCGTTQSSIPVDTRDPYSLLIASSSTPAPYNQDHHNSSRPGTLALWATLWHSGVVVFSALVLWAGVMALQSAVVLFHIIEKKTIRSNLRKSWFERIQCIG